MQKIRNFLLHPLVLWLLYVLGILLLSHIWRQGGHFQRGGVHMLRLSAILALLFILAGMVGPRFRKIFYSLLPVCTLLFLIELVFYLLSYPQGADYKGINTEVSGKPIVVNDSAYGYRVGISTHIHSILKAGNKIVYDVHYDIDSLHRRITPGRDSAGRFAAFFGCSVTYGQGVQDTQTIPYYFGQYTNGFQPYNYAYSGYGTQEMLVSLQDSTFRKGIRERQGVGIYVFIEHHVNRVIGDLQLYTMWGENMPYFYLDADSLKRNGSFHTGRYWTSLMYTLLNKSFTLHYFHFNMPAHLQDKHYELTSRIILASKRLFEQQYPNSPFVVVMYPGTTQRLIPFLKKYGIRYLDYSRLFDAKSPTYSMQPYDPHPNPYANRLLAKRLSEDIQRIEAEHR